MGIKKTPLIFFFGALFLASSAWAEVHWEPAGWEGGGCYPNVLFDPQVRDRLYLTSDVTGLWRSDDGGEHWRFATRGLSHLNVPAIAVAPSDPNILYAATGVGLFVSRDAADSWLPTRAHGNRFAFSRPESHRPILVSSTDASRLVIGTAAGQLWHSADFGRNWKFLGTPLGRASPITALAWADAEKSVYVSSQNGLAKMVLAGGRTEVLREAPKPISDILAHPINGTLYAAGQKNIWRLADGGKHWERLGAAPYGVFYRLAISRNEPDRLLAAWNEDWKGGTVTSTDGGVSWAALDKKMEPDTASDPTRIWANSSGRINALVIDPFDPRKVFRTDWWGVWKSGNGGLSWSEKIKGAPNTVTSDIFLAKNGDLYVASMDNGLLKSSDHGQTYETVFPKKGYRREENGHVWRVVENPQGELFATSTPWSYERSQVVALRTGGLVERIENGLPSKKPVKGTVWNHGYARALAAHPQDANTLYLGIDGEDGGGFFVSKDAGRSWQRAPSQPGSLKIYNGLAVDPTEPKRIYWGASGRKGGVYLSEDEGKSWRYAFSQMKKVFDVAVSADGTVYAAGDRGGPRVFFSRDHGKTWRLLKSFEGKGSAEALCPLPDGRLALGTVLWNSFAPGHVYLSSKDQKTWENIDGDLPNGEGPSALVYDAKSGTLYMARYAGSVYKTKLEP